ncbi:uncharacterized protein LOC143024803 isoform X2 [Oratosquilla oratoria]|uniref:uncharacterized protein LOC143024803 isoform X2 n=1 Tax=Oratosquilla oratoria TaxID=337810 RepID=UPI003F776BFD
MSETLSRKYVVEDSEKFQCQPRTQSADLAPVHSARLGSLRQGMERGVHTEVAPGPSGTLSSELKDKLSLKNGIVNGMKIGTTDAEIHVSAPKHTPSKGQPPDNPCSESSHDSSVNGSFCNGHSDISTISSNSIPDTLSLSSDKSSDSSQSFSALGARPRTRNSSQGSHQSKSDSAKSLVVSKELEEPECPPVPPPLSPSEDEDFKVEYVNYENELQMGAIMRLIQKDLSEPYSIYTYRYFIHNWPKLCFLAMCGEEVVGAIVCKLDVHKKVTVRGYIAMLAVDQRYRKRKIGSNLVQRAIRAMALDDADEVVLETEITNKSALRLYENLGFVRDKRLFRYYLNGVDALRLKLWLR